MDNIKILILEDSEYDVHLIQTTIKRAGIHFTAKAVTTSKDYLDALNSFSPEIILCDHGLPQFSSNRALQISRDILPYIPFILVTGTASDEFAASIIKEGADDYILKSNLNRLPTAISQAIEKKHAEKAQTLLAAIVASSDDAIISKTLDGTITSWNMGAEKIFGYSGMEAIGKNISFFIPPGLLGEEAEIINKIKRGEFLQHYETQRLNRNGRLVDISLTISPIRDARKNIIGASKIARDITERREAEQKVFQSEANLKAIFNNTSEGFILIDLAGNVKAFNDRAKESILRNVKGRLKNDVNILDFIEEPRRDAFKEIIVSVAQGEIVQYERTYKNASAKPAWIHFLFNPVMNGSNVAGVCITGRDITERKVAEQEKEFGHNNTCALINNTGDLMWSLGRDFRLITSNLAFNERIRLMTGETPVKGNNILMGGHSRKQLQQYKKYYERAFSGETFTEIEHNGNSVELWSEISFYPIYEAGAVIGTACFSRDITIRKRTEEQLNRSLIDKLALAERTTSIINALPANIALLDTKGLIVEVNEAWRKFADCNGFIGANHGIGDSYLVASKSLFREDKREGRKVTDGIRAILKGESKQFVFEYPCHSPREERWFRMVATPLQSKDHSGAVVMHIDISELRFLEQERLVSKIEEQKRVTRAMLHAQEQERNQLGQELHDNISQLLAAIKMKLKYGVEHDEEGPSSVLQCIGYVEEAIIETRNLSHRMVMPRFSDSSFAVALKDLIQSYRHEERSVEIETRDLEEEDIPANIKESLYRIAQEQLNNIEKHAKASEVIVQVSRVMDNVTMAIKDNGIGFDTKKKYKGIGLANILNRVEFYNGTAKIISAPKKGCKLFVEIPICGQV